MSRFVDVEQWPRREAYEFFRDYEFPDFNICVPLEVGRLVELSRSGQDVQFTLAFLYFAARVANEYEPFRYRLQDGRPVVHDRIHKWAPPCCWRGSGWALRSTNTRRISPPSARVRSRFGNGSLRGGADDLVGGPHGPAAHLRHAVVRVHGPAARAQGPR